MAAKKREYRHFGRARHPIRKIARRVSLCLIIFFTGYTVVTHALLSTFAINTGAMEPTLSSGDRIATTPLVYGVRIPFTRERLKGFRAPRRGELVLCTPPYIQKGAVAAILEPLIAFLTLNRGNLPADIRSELMVKRIIGLPGDSIMIADFVAYIRVRGSADFVNERELINQEYLISFSPLPDNWRSEQPFSGFIEEITLGPDEYFVLSDYRSATSDSRFFGPLSRSMIRDKVLFRYWPLRKAGGF